MTPEQLEEIRQRLAAATPGPWKWTDSNGIPKDVGTVYLYKDGVKERHDDYVFNGYFSLWQHIEIEEAEGEAVEDSVIGPVEDKGWVHELPISDANANFIEQAPTDVAALIAEVERLQSELYARRLIDHAIKRTTSPNGEYIAIVKAWLDSLEWDGKPHIEALLKNLNDEEEPK